MSLRWKLFRFLSADTLLSPTPAESTDYESSLFPSLSSTSSSPSDNSNNSSSLLSRFAAAADRAVHSHNLDSKYAFALPRAVVQLFNIPSLNLSSSTQQDATALHTRFPPQLFFSAHDNAVIAVHLVRTDHLLPHLVTLGMDSSGGTLKIWALLSPPPSQPKSSNNTPDVISASTSSTSAPSSSPPTPLTATNDHQLNPKDFVQCLAVYRFHGDVRPTTLAVSSSPNPQSPHIAQIAVGFADGVVVILSGDILNERAIRIRAAPAPGEMIEPKPVVFMQYAGPLLYTVSEVSIVVIITSTISSSSSSSSSTPTSNTTTSKSSSSSPSSSSNSSRISVRRSVLDNLGVSTHNVCCVLPHTQELVVAKPEALFFFNRDGRGPCLAFPTDGKHPLITAVGHYVIHSTGHGSITAYDVANKLIAFRGKGIATCAFASHSSIKERALAICMADGSVLRLKEIPLEDRVNMLLKRGLYLPAVRLAQSESSNINSNDKTATTNIVNNTTGKTSNLKTYDKNKTNDIKTTTMKSAIDNNHHNRQNGSEIITNALRQYAEFLMSKNRYDEAAEQLIETIGRGSDDVEPSWVITRLVEQSGLRSGLRLYLEALHAAGSAAFVHTKVLITCYRHDRARAAILGGTKTQTEKTTDEYVINVFSDVDWSEDQVDAAITLCRDAGLYHVAERVARRRKRYVQLAKTLIEDLHDAEKVLELLHSLSDRDAITVVLATGARILQKIPSQFVDYLTDAICNSNATSGKESNNNSIPSTTTTGSATKTTSTSSSSTSTSATRSITPILKLDAVLPLFIDCPHWRASLLNRVLSRPGGLSISEAPRAWILLFESLVCVDLGERIRHRLQPSSSSTHEMSVAPPMTSSIPINVTATTDDDDDELPTNTSTSAATVTATTSGSTTTIPSTMLDNQESFSDKLVQHSSSSGSANFGRNSGSNRRGVGRRALKILRNRWSVIDLRAALNIAEQYRHELCLEYLYEHLRMYRELGICLRLAKNYNALLRTCRRHGEREPQLWLEALRLFAPVAAQEVNEAAVIGDGMKRNQQQGSMRKRQQLPRQRRQRQRQPAEIENTPQDQDEQQQVGLERITNGNKEENGGNEVDKQLQDGEDTYNEKSELLYSDEGGGGDGDGEEDDLDEEDSGSDSLYNSLRLTTSMVGSGRKGAVRAQDVVDEAMQYLERNGTLSSLEIIECVVEACGWGGWGIVRDYFERCCSSLRRDAVTTEHTAALLESECEQLRLEAMRLHDETIVIKPRICSSCEDAISLPAIHFFCGHSYHVTCVASGRKQSELDTGEATADLDVTEDGFLEECVKCAPDLDAALSMKKAIADRNERHDEFFATLRSARDGYATIIEFLDHSPFL